MAGLALERKNTRIALLAGVVALAMLGLGFAAVPLYNLFCRVTGFAGTTQTASESDAAIAERIAQSLGSKSISIRFDATVAPDLPWSFSPSQTTDTVEIGVRDMMTFVARNNSDEPITGTATFNVEPEQTGKYFNKIQCFCFTSQTLRPGQEVHMPVLYYVDPAILDDPNSNKVEQITLSYTFHRAKAPESQGSS